MRVEKGVILEFCKVEESWSGFPLKVKKNWVRVRVWGKRDSLRWWRVRVGVRVRARGGIWRSGDSMKIWNLGVLEAIGFGNFLGFGLVVL